MRRNKIPLECKGCGISDNRVLIVHHKDGNRKNNNTDNLEWLCCNCHAISHTEK
jgi:5-methylcytosine-specific restriction endonuclease McrA